MPGENLRKTGNEMEDIAAQYLTERGVRILERNFRSRDAEIDIIGKQEEVLVFIEVKARRTGKKSGSAAEAVGSAKQTKICRCADRYMYEKRIDPYSAGIRFDVVAIEAEPEASDPPGEDPEAEETVPAMKDCRLRIRWIRNAFSYIPYRRTKPRWRVW